MVGVAVWFAMSVQPAAAQDPWYIDVGDHWAHPFIRVLWEESITDGWVLLGGSLGLFQPNESMTRAQYAVQLAKVFRLAPVEGSVPYQDVLPDLTITGGKPAYPWIAAAYERAILSTSAYFHPHDAITREDATDLLMKALGLNRYIDQLAPLEVSMLLHRFPDHHHITEALRPALAAATKLGIIQGYDDGLLRPKRMMTRAEGITIICRSCVLLLSLEPDVFSPDGDGIDETTTITIGTLKNRNITRWNLQVTDEHGALLHYFNPNPGSLSQPPSFVVWNGRQWNGQLLPPNTYFVRGWVRDSQGMLHWSVPQPVEIREYRIWGHITPRVNIPGSTGTISVTTNHPAESVLWKEGSEWLAAYHREAGQGREWAAQLHIENEAQEGSYFVKIRVHFDGAITRERLLPYEIYDDLSLMAWLSPTTIVAGDTLTVSALTSEQVTSVSAKFPDQTTIPLVLEDEDWQAEWVSPDDMAQGYYSVEVKAVAPTRESRRLLHFSLIRDPREDITFILIE